MMALTIFWSNEMSPVWRTASLLLCLLPSLASAVTFKIATVVPDGTPWMQGMRTAASEIEQRTEGRVKFRFYPGGVMGNDSSVLRKIRMGQLHGGVITGGGLAEVYPDSQLYGLPFLFRSLDEVDYVRERMDPVIIAGLRDSGFVSFGLSEGGFAYMMSNVPVRGVEDLRGQKVWVPEGDRISRAAFEAVGVAPISLPLTDVLTGLQTGMIDTVATSPVGAIALQWHTRVKYRTDMPLLYLYATLVVKRSVFERLSAEDQKVVQEVMGGLMGKTDQQNRLDDQQAQDALAGQGIEVITPSGDEAEQWRQQVAEAVDRLGEEGLYTPAMLAEIRTHLQSFRSQAHAAQ